MSTMEITDVPVAAVRPYPRNPRVVPDSAVDAVSRSIAKYGFRQPIVVDGENVVIAGHTRLEAAKRLGLETVPVHVADGLDPALAAEYRLADNRAAEYTHFDVNLLAREVDRLGGGGPMDIPGFDDDEIQLLTSFLDEVEPAEEDAPPPPQDDLIEELERDLQSAAGHVRVIFMVPRDMVAEVRRVVGELIQ